MQVYALWYYIVALCLCMSTSIQNNIWTEYLRCTLCLACFRFETFHNVSATRSLSSITLNSVKVFLLIFYKYSFIAIVHP